MFIFDRKETLGTSFLGGIFFGGKMEISQEKNFVSDAIMEISN